MIVRGNSPAMVIPVGILGNIAVALSRGIIISHASVVYVGWVRFEVTKYDNCVREAIIVLEFESLYIESVAMGNYIVTGLLVVAAGLISNENIAHHNSPRESPVAKCKQFKHETFNWGRNPKRVRKTSKIVSTYLEVISSVVSLSYRCKIITILSDHIGLLSKSARLPSNLSISIYLF